MLYNINESETKWEIIKAGGEGFYKIKKGTTSIGFKPSEELLKAVTEKISNENCSSINMEARLKFAYKTNDPYIVSSDKKQTSIALVSLLQTRNTVITGVQSNGIKILEFGKEPHISTNEKYINLILLVREEVGASLTLTVRNFDTKKIIEYTLQNAEEGLKLTTVEKEDTEAEVMSQKINIEKYRPVRVTNLVIVKGSDKKMVDTYFENNRKYYKKEHFTIIVCEDINEKLNKLNKEQHYKAATIFLNVPYKKSIVEKYKEQYDGIYKSLFIQFVNTNRLTKVL